MKEDEKRKKEVQIRDTNEIKEVQVINPNQNKSLKGDRGTFWNRGKFGGVGEECGVQEEAPLHPPIQPSFFEPCCFSV